MDNKIVKKITKSIFFYTILYFIIYISIGIALGFNNLTYLRWIKTISLFLILFGLIAGTIQKLLKESESNKIFGILFILEILFFSLIIVFYLAFTDTEEIVMKDNKKMVKETHSILFANWINYYDYENIFYRSKKVRIVEHYDDVIAEPDYLYTIYYDENGDKIKEYDKDGNIVERKKEDFYDNRYSKYDFSEYENSEVKTEKEPEIVVEKEEKNVTNENQIVNEVVSEILYEKIIDEKITITITNKGAILAQRLIIGVNKTTDGGKKWIEKNELQIHNGAEFLFLDENIGFINDSGLAETDGENRRLLVTVDGGKNFENANIIHPNNITEKNLFVSGVPYIENNILKVKIYTINYKKNPIKTYYEFISKDNGKNWSYNKEL